MLTQTNSIPSLIITHSLRSNTPKITRCRVLLEEQFQKVFVGFRKLS